VFAWHESDVLGSFQEVGSKRLQPGMCSLCLIACLSASPSDDILLAAGLSSMVSAPEEVADQLARLCDFAEAHIPITKHTSTRLAIMATAGLRLLPEDQQLRFDEPLALA
jgi:hypothetical protein